MGNMLDKLYDQCTRIDHRTGEQCGEEPVRFFRLNLGGMSVYGRCAQHADEEIRRYRVIEIPADDVTVMEVHER